MKFSEIINTLMTPTASAETPLCPILRSKVIYGIKFNHDDSWYELSAAYDWLVKHHKHTSPYTRMPVFVIKEVKQFRADVLSLSNHLQCQFKINAIQQHLDGFINAVARHNQSPPKFKKCLKELKDAGLLSNQQSTLTLRLQKIVTLRNLFLTGTTSLLLRIFFVRALAAFYREKSLFDRAMPLALAAAIFIKMHKFLQSVLAKFEALLNVQVIYAHFQHSPSELIQSSNSLRSSTHSVEIALSRSRRVNHSPGFTPVLASIAEVDEENVNSVASSTVTNERLMSGLTVHGTAFYMPNSADNQSLSATSSSDLAQSEQGQRLA